MKSRFHVMAMRPGVFSESVDFARPVLRSLVHPGLRARPFRLGRNAEIRIAASGIVQIDRSVHIRRDATISVGGLLRIEPGVFINRGFYVAAHEAVIIERDVLIGEYVVIHDDNHQSLNGAAFRHSPVLTAPVRIGQGAWLGARAVVLAGVTVGAAAVVAAGAVVTRSVPPGAVAAGIPARIIREAS